MDPGALEVGLAALNGLDQAPDPRGRISSNGCEGSDVGL